MRSIFASQPLFALESRNRDWKWWLTVWGPVVIAVCVICAESTDTFSSQNTSGWLRALVERIIGPIHNEQAWDVFHHYVRKSGHFVGYGTVGFTFLRAWLHTLWYRGATTLLAWRIKSTLLAIVSTAIVASGDEFHQTFIPSRTGTPLDVLLDTCGASFMCLLVWLVFWTKYRGIKRVDPAAEQTT